jgi:hypothetical protein
LVDLIHGAYFNLQKIAFLREWALNDTLLIGEIQNVDQIVIDSQVDASFTHQKLLLGFLRGEATNLERNLFYEKL